MDILTPPAWDYFKDYVVGVQGDIWKGATSLAVESAFRSPLEHVIALERFLNLRHFLHALALQIVEYKARSNGSGERSPYFNFLQDATEEETSALRALVKELRRSSLSVPMESRAGTPMGVLAESIHLITPSKLVEFAMLAREYNLEWAMASYDWSGEEGI